MCFVLFCFIKVSQLFYNTAFSEKLWRLKTKHFGHAHGNEYQLRQLTLTRWLHYCILASLGTLGLNSLAQPTYILLTKEKSIDFSSQATPIISFPKIPIWIASRYKLLLLSEKNMLENCSTKIKGLIFPSCRISNTFSNPPLFLLQQRASALTQVQTFGWGGTVKAKLNLYIPA